MSDDPQKDEGAAEKAAQAEAQADEAATIAAEAQETAEEAAAQADEAKATAEEARAEADAESESEAEAEADAEPAAEAPKPKRTRAKKAAEPAAETETEAPAAAETAAPEKPVRRSRSRKAAEPEKPAETPAPSRRRDRPRSGEQVIVRAQARYVRSSARKARLVCDGIRGKSVADARAILAFHPRQVSEAWTKLLESAVANAENNHDLVGEELKIHAVYADEGPTIKRYRPRAMGRATRIRKRTSHLTIQLTPKD
jgi:ribosomal protein L22